MIRIEEIPIERITEYWDIQYRYLVDDGMITTDEEKDYFQSPEYRDVLKGHMLRISKMEWISCFLRRIDKVHIRKKDNYDYIRNYRKQRRKDVHITNHSGITSRMV